MKNVSIARLNAYQDEPVMLIAPETIMKDFLTWLYNAIAEGRDNATKDQRHGTARHYQEFLDQIANNKQIKED